MTSYHLTKKLEKVSIIMPCYNCERFIESAINSVISQTYDNWELIICDDGSSDQTREIAYRYENFEDRITLIDNFKSKGAPGARNSCLDHATGRYIAFLDADDLWYPEKLSIQLKFMGEHSSVFCFTYQDVINENGEYQYSIKAPSRVSKKKMRITNFIPCVTAIYDSYALGKIYQPNIRKRNDYALWLKLLDKTEANCLNLNTASYRSNSYGLASGGKLELLKYYISCMLRFGGCNRPSLVIRVPIYLMFMLLKKSNVRLFNWLVIRL
jgi:teichuronic acid biosynthesis glycosyltransferase TuaG